jgi:glycosyltransferase involved in cell wall biosynthesis
MKVSVVVRSKDEADRLRLVLASLARQTNPAEVIVVDDGSTDHTREVLAEAAAWLPFRVVTHETARGRSGAANAGAAVATGDVLLFLDGDTLAHPELVERHVALHRSRDRVVGRGETYHLRGTRFLQDPETGTPRPGEEARLARLPEEERLRLRVTRRDVMENFATIDARAQPGIYPGAGPRRLYELEMDALRHHPECEVLWAAACGNNLSVRTKDFRQVGGFDEKLDFSEHRELALRLCRSNARMAPVAGARTYHLTHRNGWRDPLQETAWEAIFYEAHPLPSVKLLSVFWAGFFTDLRIPKEARIDSLPGLADACRTGTDCDHEAIRRLIPRLSVLPAGKAASAQAGQ